MGRACAECLRMVLVIYNFILVLIGLVILGFAVYAYIEPVAQQLIEATNKRALVTGVLFVLMGLGSLTLVVALFGCCGAYHESPCLLSTYFIFLIIIFTIQISGAAAGYYYREEIFAETEKTMQDGVFDYMKPVDPMSGRPLFMKAVQKVFECCGVHGPKEYDGRIPISCCITSQSSCNSVDLKREEVYQEGCLEKYKETAISFLQILFLVVFAISFFEGLSVQARQRPSGHSTPQPISGETSKVLDCHASASGPIPSSCRSILEPQITNDTHDTFHQARCTECLFNPFRIFGLLLSIIMWCIVRKYTADYYEVDYGVSS